VCKIPRTNFIFQSARACKQAEYAAQESREQASQLSAENQSLGNSKRKFDQDLQALHHDLDETLNELRASEDNAKKAMADAAKLAEELRQEQEHSMHIERTRKGLEQQIKEMQARLDEAEAAALKGGKKVIAKLEQRIRDLEAELDNEQRRHSDVQKSLAKLERRQREIEFQIEEDKKNHARLTDLADKLQQKLKASKKQVEEAVG
jgi:chromosome segregation ATPase